MQEIAARRHHVTNLIKSMQMTNETPITFRNMFGSSFSQSDVQDLRGKTALVTGATNGIGFEVAKALSLADARVLLLSRKEENGEDAVAKIKELKPKADVHFISCDLGNLQQVKSIADHVRASEKRLDIVIADAGVGVNKYDLTSDGIERHFAVNHLGHFLLLNRIFPLIRKTSVMPATPPPRIVTLSSELHRTAPSSTVFADEQEINEGGRNLSANQLYSRSKLANLLFTKYGLAQRVIEPNGYSILAVATHPGAVHTGQQDQFKEAYGTVFGTMMKGLVVPFMRNPEQGSFSTLWAATCQDMDRKDMQGHYFTNPGEFGKETQQASDETIGGNLWRLSEKMIREKLGPNGLLPWDSDVKDMKGDS